MAQKVYVHLKWSPSEGMWMFGDSHYEGGDLERVNSNAPSSMLSDPSLFNVVQWGDRERGEGPYPELYSAECCIKSALPFLSRDEKTSFLDEALSNFRAFIRGERAKCTEESAEAAELADRPVHKASSRSAAAQARKGPAVAQMTDPESPIVTAAEVAAPAQVRNGSTAAGMADPESPSVAMARKEAAVAAMEARKEAAAAAEEAEAIAADPQAWMAARKADALAKREERLVEERTKAAARNLTRSEVVAALAPSECDAAEVAAPTEGDAAEDIAPSVRECRKESNDETQMILEKLLGAISQESPDDLPLDAINASNEKPKVWRAIEKQALKAYNDFEALKAYKDWTPFLSFQTLASGPATVRLVITANRAHWLDAWDVPPNKHALIGKTFSTLTDLVTGRYGLANGHTEEPPGWRHCELLYFIPFEARTNGEKVKCVLWTPEGLGARRRVAKEQEPHQITKLKICKQCGQLCQKLCGGCAPAHTSE